MEKKKTIDRVCFEKTCNALILSAVAEVSPFIESLDLNNLEENRKKYRVSPLILFKNKSEHD